MKAKEMLCLSTSVYKLDGRDIFKKKTTVRSLSKWVVNNEVRIISIAISGIILKEIFIYLMKYPYISEIFKPLFTKF